MKGLKPVGEEKKEAAEEEGRRKDGTEGQKIQPNEVTFVQECEALKP